MKEFQWELKGWKASGPMIVLEFAVVNLDFPPGLRPGVKRFGLWSGRWSATGGRHVMARSAGWLPGSTGPDGYALPFS